MQPLKDVRVIEFTNILSGPFCGMLLSDMGADVIKVEKPTGDDMRFWPPISDGYSENFASVNRNKRSIALNLKDAGDLQLALDLCAGADVVIENNRAGAMDRPFVCAAAGVIGVCLWGRNENDFGDVGACACGAGGGRGVGMVEEAEVERRKRRRGASGRIPFRANCPFQTRSGCWRRVGWANGMSRIRLGTTNC